MSDLLIISGVLFTILTTLAIIYYFLKFLLKPIYNKIIQKAPYKEDEVPNPPNIISIKKIHFLIIWSITLIVFIITLIKHLINI